MALLTSWSGKGPGKCTRVKDDDQQQNGVKKVKSRGDRFRSTVRMNIPGDMMALWYDVVNFVGKM